MYSPETRLLSPIPPFGSTKIGVRTHLNFLAGVFGEGGRALDYRDTADFLIDSATALSKFVIVTFKSISIPVGGLI